MIALLIVVAAFVVGMLMPEPKEQAPVKEDYDFKIRWPKPAALEEQETCEQDDACCENAA